jgi:hypothetical protein
MLQGCTGKRAAGSRANRFVLYTCPCDTNVGRENMVDMLRRSVPAPPEAGRRLSARRRIETCAGSQIEGFAEMRISKRDSDPGPVHAFAGACLLTAALLLPHAPMIPVIAGMALAALVRWTWR